VEDPLRVVDTNHRARGRVSEKTYCRKPRFREEVVPEA
jgi:hypothetical protein